MVTVSLSRFLIPLPPPASPVDLRAGRAYSTAMKKIVKRVLLAVVAVVVVVVASVVALMVSVFSGNAPMPDSGPIAGGNAILVKDGYVAAFIVAGADQDADGDVHGALVDCGNDVAATAILAELKARHVKVDGIFLTHGHPDHTHGCAAILRAFPGAFLAAHGDELPAMAGKVAYLGPIPKMSGAEDTGLKVDRILKDGDAIQVGGVGGVGGVNVTAFAVPGHTAGTMMYLAKGVLFFGDAATGADDGSVKAAPGVFSDDVPQSVESLHQLAAKLASADVQTFAFAHSGPLPADLAKLKALTR